MNTYLRSVDAQKPELVRRGLTERPSVGKAMPREVFRCAEWSSPAVTAMIIQNAAPERGWSFR